MTRYGLGHVFTLNETHNKQTYVIKHVHLKPNESLMWRLSSVVRTAICEILTKTVINGLGPLFEIIQSGGALVKASGMKGANEYS